MSNATLPIGLIGSLILVTGAAWPDKKHVGKPLRSIKNWLFAIGAVLMFLYSTLIYFEGQSVFFIFLEALILIATVMMMLDVPDRWDTPILTVSGLGFIIWSLYLFEGYNTIFFIIGLTGVALGYALQMGSIQRSAALTVGSALITVFSYIESNWIFFWLNFFFAIFSLYYVITHPKIYGTKNRKT